MALFEVEGLTTRFATQEGDVAAVSDVSFTVEAGERVGVVGESGSGKSQLFMTIMGLLAANGRASGEARLEGRNLIGMKRDELNTIRGSRMAMIFQDPMTCLNPYLTVGRQLAEVLVTHKGTDAGEAWRLSARMLARVGIPDAERRLDMYPHEFSGGMRQRVMIAMSLLCQPALLIADEPTTALDVTVQAQILDLFRDLVTEERTALVMITHDLGVVAGLCDRVIVMYGGRIIEQGPVREIFYRPRHPYTRGLLAALPRLDTEWRGVLPTIPGQPPNLQRLPPGCAFSPRCPNVMERCRVERPILGPVAPERLNACHLEDLDDRSAA